MSERALVLGGGGASGNAWVIGVIAGLFEAGLDVTEADLIIGTSAGSTAAAQMTSATPTELLAGILSAEPPQDRSDQSRRRPVPIGPAADHMEMMNAIIGAAEDAADMRRRMGAAALETDEGSDGSSATKWRLPSPPRAAQLVLAATRMLIPAVDADSGEPVVFDRRSGVDLVDAVAASSSNGFGVPPYSIGDRRYIDGGYRRNENADLAAGYARVLVLSPFGGRSLHPIGWGMDLAAQAEELRASGSRVETIFPDSNSQNVLGDGMKVMDLRGAALRSSGLHPRRSPCRAAHRFWR